MGARRLKSLVPSPANSNNLSPRTGRQRARPTAFQAGQALGSPLAVCDTENQRNREQKSHLLLFSVSLPFCVESAL